MSEDITLRELLAKEGKTMRELLEEQVYPSASWGAARPYALKDRILLVPELDVVEVGVAFADDQRETVSHWIDEGHVRAPTTEEYAAYDEYQPSFRALLVLPWLFIQQIKDGKPPAGF